METAEADCESDSMDKVSAMSCTDLQGKFLECSTLFINLYDQRRGQLQTSMEKFTGINGSTHKMQKTNTSKIVRGMFGAVGGAILGAGFGTVTGAAAGAFGGVFSMAFGILVHDIGAVDALGSFSSSTIGGASGGAVAGALGGAIVGAVEAVMLQAISGVGDVVLCSFGCIIGGALGSLFGSVGAPGGALVGAFGAMCGTNATIALLVTEHHALGKTNESNKEITELKVVQKTGEDFHEIITPLVKELKTIKEISDTSFCAIMQGVARQIGNALAAAARMRETLAGISRPKDKASVASRVTHFTRQCQQTTEEFEKMRTELDKLLA
ncbi:uncharacterized protein LOC130128020 [Lampris incognitus]|uniref:uncharacterized protein LOC130128020 n=1 Tax=Lampris incognitus TaxID=2546036 RepID=UPI0024B5302D|nr:uncharacterized protein LOC130128020 [Lampris incognitus]